MTSTNVTDDIKGALRASKKSFLAAGFFSLFINLLILTAPLYMLQVYDRVVTSRSLETLLFLTLIMLFMFGVMGVMEWVRSRILVRTSNQIDNYLSQRVYSAMFKLAVRSPENRTSQALSDLNSFRQFLTGNGLFALFDAPWLPIYIGVMFLFHESFGWFSIAAAVILLCIAIANEKTTKKTLSEASGEHISAQSLATSNLRNAELLHAMGMLPHIMQRWYRQNQAYLLKQTQASDRAGVFTNLSKVLRMIFQSLILGLGAYYVVLNEMSPGMMIAGSILLGRALAPLDLLTNSWAGFNNALSARQRLTELLEAISADDRKLSLPSPAGKIQIENLTVIPPGAQKPAIQNITLTVSPGELVAVVGPSAAGKTTLARAILGIWPATVGAVRIDGADIQHYNRDEIGPHLGYLPQDIELFNGTIAENIARFSDVDPEKIVEAAIKAGVHEMILRLPEAYDTPIGVDSGALSGGQRQRIGLARALYGSPKILVLDEPNSNLDEQGELALAKTIEKLKHDGTTIFIITHKAAILKYIDKLLVLNDGQLQLFGPRDDVMAKITSIRTSSGAPA